MDETARYAVGLDVGTENIRAVVASVDKTGKLSVVGYNEAKNMGMRKGILANLAGPADAIDRMLGEVERMSGYEIPPPSSPSTALSFSPPKPKA